MIRSIFAVIFALTLTGCSFETTSLMFGKELKDPTLSAKDAKWVAQAPQFALDESYKRREVSYQSKEPKGTIIVEVQERALYLVGEKGMAIRYSVSTGAEAHNWVGEATVQRKAEWPNWTAPAEMLQRWPHLPRSYVGGPKNPLGARALYLYAAGKDTLYRIHGTNEPESIGTATSSGCIRMLNIDAIDLYNRVGLGTKVIVR
jgi:lipoprotein-anchoring transpeptidase ErfK/SrfK